MKPAVRILSSKGMGLLEVMISVAILSVVMAGLCQATYISMLQTSTADVKYSAANVTGMVGQIALDQNACTAAITKVSQNYGNPIRFDLANGQIIASSQNVAGYGVFVNSFNYQGTTVRTDPDGTTIYFGTFTLALATKRQVIGPNTFAPRAVASVYLTVNPAGQISQCGAALPPAPPIAPPVAPPPPAEDPAFARGCIMVGGEMSHGTCIFRSGGR